jgi:hypothetical protein
VFAALMILIYPIGTPVLYYVLLRRNRAALEKLQVNQTLRVQLLNTVRAEGDYVSSRVSIDKRQVEWLLSPADRKALPIQVLRKLRQLEREEMRARERLPGSISKLIKGYELRMCRFEIFECGRKLAVACLPVFFQPSGSASQLVFGLMVCFVAFGAYVHFDPYEDRGNDAVAALCQMQIFFSLLASVALTSASDDTGTNMGVLLVVLYFLPVGLAVFLESPLLKFVQKLLDQQTEEATSAQEASSVTTGKAASKLNAVRRLQAMVQGGKDIKVTITHEPSRSTSQGRAAWRRRP